MGMVLKIVDIGAMLLVLNRIDEGFPGTQRVTDLLLNGDFRTAFTELMQGIQVLLKDKLGRQDLIAALLMSGAVRVVREAGFSVPKITLGDITFTL